MIIVIDGPAGTGKSTVAKKIAKQLGFTFFDTGAMYRSFAWLVVQQEKIDPRDEQAVCELLSRFDFEMKIDGAEERRYLVGGHDVTKTIREQQISNAASLVATYPKVRSAMVEIQRKYGSQCNAVFEGRDMGTVVFPDAGLKIFLTARPEIRAKRRYEELAAKFPDMAHALEFDRILEEILERDRNDSTRKVSPLKQAPDAHLIDTSELSIDEVVEQILQKVPRSNLYPKMRWIYAAIYWIARCFFKVCFRLKIYGLNHWKAGPGIIAANHTSNFDPPVLSISCPEEVHFLAKESLFTVPLLGKLIRILNSHPVSRSATDASVFRDLIRLLREGKKVILFPEGTRSHDGTLQPLERGLSFIVQKGNCPIFPAYIQGTFDAWPAGRKIPKIFGRIAVVFGTPIEWSEFKGLDKREAEARLTEKTTASLQALKDWLDAGAQGTPP
jgi:cytidylate kinase